jgi:hypothetical protein
LGKKTKKSKKIPDLSSAAVRKFLKFSSPRRRLYVFRENRRLRLSRSAYTSSRYIQKHSFKERIQGTVALPFEKEMAGVLQIFLSFHRTKKYK